MDSDFDLDREVLKEIHEHCQHFTREVQRYIADESESIRKHTNRRLLTIVTESIDLILKELTNIVVNLKELGSKNFQWPRSLFEYVRHESLSAVDEMSHVKTMCTTLEENIFGSIKKIAEEQHHKVRVLEEDFVEQVRRDYEEKLKKMRKHFEHEMVKQRKQFAQIINDMEAERNKTQETNSRLVSKVEELQRKVWSLPQHIESFLSGPKGDIIERSARNLERHF